METNRKYPIPETTEVFAEKACGAEQLRRMLAHLEAITVDLKTFEAVSRAMRDGLALTVKHLSATGADEHER